MVIQADSQGPCSWPPQPLPACLQLASSAIATYAAHPPLYVCLQQDPATTQAPAAKALS